MKTLGMKGIPLAWWISTYDERGLKLMNRLNQPELHKAMKLKWMLIEVLDQPARNPLNKLVGETQHCFSFLGKRPGSWIL